jgi:hypothetical protein
VPLGDRVLFDQNKSRIKEKPNQEFIFLKQWKKKNQPKAKSLPWVKAATKMATRATSGQSWGQGDVFKICV